jgi:dolichol-phosphate mannosyltransferase
LHSKETLSKNKELNIDAIGYKILLEILVKTKNVNIKEIPYTFQDRELGSSKLSIKTIRTGNLAQAN